MIRRFAADSAAALVQPAIMGTSDSSAPDDPAAIAPAGEPRSGYVRGVVACIAATTTVTITLGLAWPLLALVLERQGVPAWLNGLSASAQMVAVLAIAAIAPPLIGRLGTVRVMGLGMAGMAVSLALLPVFPNVWAWFPIRFVLGLSAELVFTGGDIWINQLARDRSRGRLIGLYSTFLHGGFALGPIAIGVLGSHTWLALYLGIAVILAGIALLRWVGNMAPAIEGRPRARLLHFFRIAPTLMVAGLMFGLIETSVIALLPVYGIHKGLEEHAATLLLTMFVAGAVLGQLPSGWLADHVERHRLLAAFTLVAFGTLVALPFVIGHGVLTWAVMLAMGTSIGSFYVIALSMMGGRFRGADLIGINASFVFMWGIGMVVGPGLSGGAMELFGPDGMPATGACLSALFLILVGWRIRVAARATGYSGPGPEGT